jgi:hypothetical protein
LISALTLLLLTGAAALFAVQLLALALSVDADTARELDQHHTTR